MKEMSEGEVWPLKLIYATNLFINDRSKAILMLWVSLFQGIDVSLISCCFHLIYSYVQMILGKVKLVVHLVVRVAHFV